MTWHSDADFIKDLAYLDDFCTAENPYEVLYSFGRGTSTKLKPKESHGFIDPRTGEKVDITNELLEAKDTFKSRGRGSFLGSCAKSKLQLQKQLRLARPLGSGNEIIESYCKRNTPVENCVNSAIKPASESDITEVDVPAEISNTVSQPQKIRQKVKATRNSKLQQNALITNLLSGALTTPNLKDNECDDYFQDIDYNDENDTNKTESDNSSSTSAGYLSCLSGCSSTSMRESDDEKFIYNNKVKTDFEINYTNIREGKNVPSVNNCDEISNIDTDIIIKDNVKSLMTSTKPTDTVVSVFLRPIEETQESVYNFDKLSKHLNALEVSFSQPQPKNTCIHSGHNIEEFPPLPKRKSCDYY